jgi:hypothetical protein
MPKHRPVTVQAPPNGSAPTLSLPSDDTCSKQIALVNAIRHHHAARIIAAGLFSDQELWTDLASSIGESEAKKPYEALCAALGPATQVPDPHRPGDTAFAVDVLTSLYTAYLDAGFLVGLAVGLQLGPHAFDTAAQSKGGAR